MFLLDDLLAQMRAAPEISGIQVVENEVVDDETFVFKVHASLPPYSLQIRFLSDKNLSRYSFQLYGDRPFLRWDNAPHYPDLPDSPHHFHDQDGSISPSGLTGNLLQDFDLVMAAVKKFMG